MNKNCGIYKITNLINGKIYIGQSIHINVRFRKHRSIPFNPNEKDYNKDIYKDIRELGLENFSFEIIDYCSEEDLNTKEIYYIDYFDCLEPKGYNKTKGGNGHLPTPEWVIQVKKALKETNISSEELGEKYGVSGRTIRSINQGETWYDENINYPIRIENTHNQKNYCKVCGKELKTKEGKICQECFHLQTRKVQDRPDREQLKQMIRNISFMELGRKYGVRDNTIRKWCKAVNLPTKRTDIENLSDEEWLQI